MAVSSPSSLGGLNKSIAQSRELLDELHQQLATGKKVQTYGDLGEARSQVLSLRGDLSRNEAYRQTGSLANTRVDTMLESLNRFRELSAETKSDALEFGFELQPGGQTVYQTEIGARFDEAVSLLNTEAAGRHLFAGREIENKPVAAPGDILNGTGTQAGFKQIVDERRQADLGADGRGRLVLDPPPGDTATIAEDAAGSPFGFKLASVTSSLSGTNVSGPAGTPPSVDVEFTTGDLPQDGESLRLTLDMPDGTSKDVTLTARASGPAEEGEFLIGADAAETATNFQDALTQEIETAAQRELSAASLYAAADDFFDFDADNPPQRVDGPPFDTATSLRDATQNDTVFWYQGELSDTPARETALAKVDDSITVSYGARANEDSFRETLKTFAAVAVEEFDPADPHGSNRYNEIKLRASDKLGFGRNAQAVDDVISEIGVAKTTIARAEERHQANEALLQGFVEDKENADLYEVSASILSLRNRIEASLTVSSRLSNLSLVRFL